MTTLVINPSSIISTFCYSIYRIETDSVCEYSCRYCYARWYRIENRKIITRHLDEFRRFIRYISSNYDRVPVFRMSTLVEPLQDRALMRAEYVLKTCNTCKVPLIINTKSTNIVKNDKILEQVIKLAEKRLVLVQVSLCTLDDEKAKILEPKAPSSSQRIYMMDILKDHGIKLVVRYQPMIPGIVDEEYEQVVKLCRDLSINHIIVEPLRIETDLLTKLKLQVPELGSTEWEPYTELGTSIVRPCTTWLRKILMKFKNTVEKYSIGFATCKDPKINMLYKVEDCCGIYMLNRDRVLKKATIYEVKRYNIHTSTIELFLEEIEKISREFIGRTYISKLDKEHRKKIKSHYKLLLKKLGHQRDIELTIY